MRMKKRASKKNSTADEAKFRATLDASPVPMALNDDAHNITYLNPAFIQTFGYSLEDIPTLADWWARAYPDSDYRQWVVETWQSRLEQAKQSGKPFSPMEIRARCKNGMNRMIVASAASLKGSFEDNHLVVLQDITPWKQMEEALRASEKKYQILFDTLTDGIALNEIIYNGQGEMIDYRVLEVNQAFYSIADYKGVVVGNYATKLYGLSQEAIKSFWHEHKTRTTPVLTEMLSPIKGRYYLISTSPFVNGRFVTSFFDITDRKLVEQELVKAREKAEENEEKFKAITNQTTEGIALSDLDGNYLFVNPAFCEMTGYSEDELLKMTVFDVKAKTQPHSSFFESKSSRAGLPIEVNLKRKDGSEFFTEIIGNVIKINNKDVVLGTVRDISGRKLAEERLRKLSQAVERSQVSVVITDVNGNIEYVNSKFVQVTGYTPAEVIGLNPRILKSEETTREEYKRLWDTITAGGEWRGEFHNRRKNGELFWESTLISPVVDETGRITHFMAVKEDTTERKQMLEALRESESNLAAVFNATNEAIFLLAADHTLLALNDAALQRTGLPREAALGRKTYEILPPDVYKWRQPFIDRAISSGKALEFEDNRDNHYLVNRLCPILDKDGKTVRLAVHSRDVTASRELHQALHESEEKYRTVANFTYDWEAWRAPDGSYLYVSPSCQRICGHSAAEFMEDQNLLIKITHPEDRSIVNSHYRELNFESRSQDGQLDFRIITPDGSTRWISHHCTPVNGDDGVWLGRRESNRDITDRKLMEQELRIQHEFATQILALMGQGLTVTNADGRFEFVNPAYAKLFGHEPAEIIGKTPSDVTLPDDRNLLAEQRTKRKAGQITTYETRLVRADGSIAPVLITGVPRESNGKYAGAVAVITDLTEQKRIEAELRDAKKLLEKSLAREQKLAQTDALTGISNRRHLFELARRKFAVAKRYKQPLAVMMFDIDLFKEINDEFGHDLGDQVLISAARVAATEIRSADVIARYGGDEFVILLPMTTAKQAHLLAERICTNMNALQIPSEKGMIATTLSIGIIEFDHASPSVTLESIFQRADEAMYQAKNNGRNRVVTLGPS